MDHNQVKYSQHRLSFYQQSFKFGATTLVGPFWTDGHEGPSSLCPRQVFSFYIMLAPTLPKPAPCRLSWIKMAKNYSLCPSWFSFHCLNCLTERQRWTPGSMQGRKHYCSSAELTLLQKWWFHCQPSLPTNNCQQRNWGKNVKHTHILNPSVHHVFKRNVNLWLLKRL